MAPRTEARWDGPLDELPSTARKLLGARAYRRLWSTYRWLSHEKVQRGSVPLTERFEMWSRGFYAESADLYAFARNDPADYLSDLDGIRASGRCNAWEGIFEHRMGLRAFLLARGFAQPHTAAFVFEGRILAEPFGGDGTYVEPDVMEARLRVHGEDAVWLLKVEDRSGPGSIDFRDNRQHETFGMGRLKDPTIIEARLEQSDFARSLYPGSTNSLRFLTLWPRGRPAPFVARAVQRIGTATTGRADDWARGAISAPIDLQTGRLGLGRVRPLDEPAPKDGLIHHPDSGARIAGATMPGWNELLDTVIRAASSVPFNRVAAWDVVSTSSEGPVILAASGRSDLSVLQVHGGLLTDPDIRGFYESVSER
ncbi:MAG TPA: sugar-transfer associated ATP-grasp domain-containing protein [Gemmatimonadales bacterium]|nr:sugar-transfer associated ATP-grasp domain-containing protein [Gemmatimonadales bacterium]